MTDDSPYLTRDTDSHVSEGSIMRMTGYVRWYSDSKGFGFITGDDQQDYFVHRVELLGAHPRTLRERQRVEFTQARDDRGMRAAAVTVLE